jgi:hypothetical protein
LYSIYLFVCQLVAEILAVLLELSIITLALFRLCFSSFPCVISLERTTSWNLATRVAIILLAVRGDYPESLVLGFSAGIVTASYFANPTYPYKKILGVCLLLAWYRILLVASSLYVVLLCTYCFLLYLVFRQRHFGSSLSRSDHGGSRA